MPNQPKNQARFENLFIRHFKMMVILTVAIILGLAYFLLLGPKYRQLTTGGRFNLASQRQESKALAKRLADLKILQKNLDDLEKYDLSRLKFILPEEQDLPGLFVQLEKLTMAENLILSNVNIAGANAATAAGDSAIKKLNLSLTVSGGNYVDLLRLLDAFEYNLRLMDVTAISFNPKQPIYNISLITYYLAP